MKSLTLFGAIIASSVVLNAGLAISQGMHNHEEAKHEASTGHSHHKSQMHGGQVVMTDEHHFEVVFMPDHVMVYLYDKNQNPIPAKAVTGEVTLKFKDGRTQKSPLTLVAAGKMMGMHQGGGHGAMMHGKKPGHMKDSAMMAPHQRMSDQDHLVAKIALHEAKEGEVRGVFHLMGLPGAAEKHATFSSKYKKMMPQQQVEHEGQEHHH